MKDMDGMELAREIRKFDRKVQIVFLTGKTDYVFEGCMRDCPDSP